MGLEPLGDAWPMELVKASQRQHLLIIFVLAHAHLAGALGLICDVVGWFPVV
jgi:hypothetical protein